MFNFKGINFESIKLRVGSLIGRLFTYHKEEHDEKTLNLELKKTEVIGTQIGRQQIGKQIVVNMPEGISPSDQKKLLSAALSGGIDTSDEEPVSSDASGNAQLPSNTTSTPAEDFLRERITEYLRDESLLLDRGGLFLVYKERDSISFSKEELVFLTQSSIRNDFPIWFWSFNYRERFESVVPLFQSAFRHSSQKIRRGVVDALNDFSDTSDNIVRIMEAEYDPHLLGFSISKFLEKNDAERAQRVLANALTRKIIPILTEKGQKKIEAIRIDLGTAEKRFLYSVIENGWPEEKLKALTILHLSAAEADLPILENLLTKATYTNIINLVLNCIKRIGKTSEAVYIDKELSETRWEESFVAHLDALVGIKYKAIFPRLLEWLGNINKVTNRLWRDADERKLEEKIQSAISALLDKDAYELLVQYILKHYSPDEYGNIMSWRHFRVLKEQKDNPEIVALLKSETRLKDFECWRDITSEIDLKEKTSTADKVQLLSFVTPENGDQNFAILRKTYEFVTPEQAVTDIAPLINKLREDLDARLKSVASGEHTEEVKELAKNELERFLGENRMFYRLHRKKKKGSRYKAEGEKDEVFEKLSKDIENFSIIEKEYFTHIFKAKTPDINKILLDSIGRPYESIYDSIEEDSGNLEQLEGALSKVIESSSNPLIRLKAIEAMLRIKATNKGVLRDITLSILKEARDNVKASRGMSKGDDDWFVSEITYLWAINTLIEFGISDDFPLIEEATNREKIIARSYHWYSYFFDYGVFTNLLNLTEILEDNEERKNAFSALDTLDYKWSKKVLNIEA